MHLSYTSNEYRGILNPKTLQFRDINSGSGRTRDTQTDMQGDGSDDINGGEVAFGAQLEPKRGGQVEQRQNQHQADEDHFPHVEQRARDEAAVGGPEAGRVEGRGEEDEGARHGRDEGHLKAGRKVGTIRPPRVSRVP